MADTIKRRRVALRGPRLRLTRPAGYTRRGVRLWSHRPRRTPLACFQDSRLADDVLHSMGIIGSNPVGAKEKTRSFAVFFWCYHKYPYPPRITRLARDGRFPSAGAL